MWETVLLVGVVATLAQYAMAVHWKSRIPERMITHIGLGGPDGWMPREQGLRIGWMLAASITVLFVILSSRPYHGKLRPWIVEAGVQLLLLVLIWYLYRVNWLSNTRHKGLGRS
jgi:hypothetical protein